MPIFSLPSPYGIGTLGKAARDFVDFLADAGQSWWQVLPLGRTSYGDSPYQSPSVFAGNPYFIDLDMLVDEGMLTREEIEAVDWGSDPERVDYGKMYENRLELLKKAAERGMYNNSRKVSAFIIDNCEWLTDYALFMAIKRQNGMKSWLEWDEDVRLRRPEAIERCRRELSDEIRLYMFIQYLFFKQWGELRQYAHQKGVRIIGDLPIYVAMDSVDVWMEPENFLLDEKGYPIDVAGVPPDSFSKNGQLWGNPLYNYDKMSADGFSWWIKRMGGAEKLYDVVRIDHFRGLESYWAVPYGHKTARKGRWVKGPGMKLISVLKNWFPYIWFIAEDLGYPTPEVQQLLSDSGFPGMKLLEFSFDSRDGGDRPYTFGEHTVCYIGTHDNSPAAGWRKEAPRGDVQQAKEYLGLNRDEGWSWGMIRGGMATNSRLFIAQMQDYLGLGSEARINTPGIAEGNWQWRMKPDAITPDLTKKIAKMTKLFGR
jgi:4-alpha-glucanotransferase